ncbi:hypothetical protein GTO27_03980 [Candidatus Bathyarchaeota archaeon]|nr:hypothetical protein [Candidatus Bathyarchaeota archaeon]
MGGPSEREYREKLIKIQENLSKRAKEVQKYLSKIEKIKADALRKTEDMRRSADKQINKIEKNIEKSKDLAPESKQRLHSEIAMLRNETEDDYGELRRQIAESIVSVAA